MAFKLADGEQVRTVPVAVASATVIPAGDFAGLTAGLAVDAGASTAAIAWCPKGSADGETSCELTVGNDFTLVGTGDAVFAVSQKGTEVDLTAAQLIDVGESTTDVLKIDISENAGTVDSTDNIRVRINKPLF
ncbi:MAG TPA: hypothetical protein VMY59_02315 [Candidatus Thermoplasmatota archaeon]|nr:hypothetical protein [Candidatus Thermoplasmatota archaeon]